MNKLVKYLIGIVATLVTLYIAWYFSSIVIYIIISAVIALMGKPLMNAILKLKIKEHKVPRSLAASITLISFLGVFAALFFIIAPPTSCQSARFKMRLFRGEHGDTTVLSFCIIKSYHLRNFSSRIFNSGVGHAI